MTQLERLNILTEGEGSEELLTLYLDIAESKILERLYPLATDRSEYSLPDFYLNKQLQIAHFLYTSKGTWGMTSHTEQGVTDTYASADIPPELLSDIIPYAARPSDIVHRGA